MASLWGRAPSRAHAHVMRETDATLAATTQVTRMIKPDTRTFVAAREPVADRQMGMMG